MTERIDHPAEARMHIEWAHDQQARAGEFDESVQHNATLAVAEATLALVEQQRIANIIALVAVPAVHAESLDRYPGVKDQILEALGLS